jgi:hypothetical protein
VQYFGIRIAVSDAGRSMNDRELICNGNGVPLARITSTEVKVFVVEKIIRRKLRGFGKILEIN